MDQSAALAQLGAQCAATVYPTLSRVDLVLLLNAVAKFKLWMPNTTYAHGDVVIPTVRNGHTYRAIVNQQYSATPAGVTDAVEPIWPLFSSPDSRVGVTRPYWSGYDQQSGNYSLSMVTDGTIVWQDAGADSAQQWDLRRATYNAWLQKAGLASADYAVGIDRDKYGRDQVIAHCMQMARSYAPTGIA